MNEFLTVIGQIFLIACIQSVIEVFIDTDKRPYMSKIANFACYVGALYILLQFMFEFLLAELFSIVRFAF